VPDRVTQQNVVWFVQDHERRLQMIERHTEDLPVIRSDVERVRRSIHELRGDIEGVRKMLDLFASKDDVESLRKALYTFALSVAGSAVVFALTLLSIYK